MSATDLMQTPRPTGGFRCILADPPWSFETRTRERHIPHRTEEAPYSTLSLPQLARIPVHRLAAKDCALFMWVVDSHIPQALSLGTAWGFGFKTRVFTWRKTTQDGTRSAMGMGFWSRKETELCFLFTRGTVPRLSGGVREIIDAPRREHSRKPDEQYARIEALVDGPRLELFARQQWPGWTAWGNQTDKYEAA